MAMNNTVVMGMEAPDVESPSEGGIKIVHHSHSCRMGWPKMTYYPSGNGTSVILKASVCINRRYVDDRI